MSDDTSRESSHTTALMVLMLTLPFIYVFSVGPAIYCIEKFPAVASMEYAIETFYAPLVWLGENTSLEGPLDEYGEWWRELAAK